MLLTGSRVAAFQRRIGVTGIGKSGTGQIRLKIEGSEQDLWLAKSRQGDAEREAIRAPVE